MSTYPRKPKPKKWKWCGHPHHFVDGRNCLWHMATFVADGTVLVSSVGDYYPRPDKRETLGWGPDSWYETFVFQSSPYTLDPCPITEYNELESQRYATVEEANAGHYALCIKYDAQGPGLEVSY